MTESMQHEERQNGTAQTGIRVDCFRDTETGQEFYPVQVYSEDLCGFWNLHELKNPDLYGEEASPSPATEEPEAEPEYMFFFKQAAWQKTFHKTAAFAEAGHTAVIIEREVAQAEIVYEDENQFAIIA